MPRLLVTGMSGTGKSSVLVELAGRGLRVVDTDDPGWSREVATPGGRGLEQVWVEDEMSALLAAAGTAPLVVSGTASNQGRFYDRFDAIVLLSAPEHVIRQRIASRTGNPFGKSPEELARILQDLADVEPILRATCTVEIDATRPLVEVADLVESLIDRQTAFGEAAVRSIDP